MLLSPAAPRGGGKGRPAVCMQLLEPSSQRCPRELSPSSRSFSHGALHAGDLHWKRGSRRLVAGRGALAAPRPLEELQEVVGMARRTPVGGVPQRWARSSEGHQRLVGEWARASRRGGQDGSPPADARRLHAARRRRAGGLLVDGDVRWVPWPLVHALLAAGLTRRRRVCRSPTSRWAGHILRVEARPTAPGAVVHRARARSSGRAAARLGAGLGQRFWSDAGGKLLAGGPGRQGERWTAGCGDGEAPSAPCLASPLGPPALQVTPRPITIVVGRCAGSPAAVPGSEPPAAPVRRAGNFATVPLAKGARCAYCGHGQLL